MNKKPTRAQSCQGTNTDHASRARDNKRRHRARQKEYVLDLEQKVAEARERGVHATKEVQVAAQRVARENANLKDLLRRIGYTDDAIGAWLREDGCVHSADRYALILESTSKNKAQGEPSISATHTETEIEARGVSVEGAKPCPSRILESREWPTKTFPHQDESGSTRSEVSRTEVCAKPIDEAPLLSGYPDDAGAPCKVLTMLAKNPAADITQVSLLTQSDKQSCEIGNPDDCSSDGVDCSSAYNILMQYATSDQRMDKIAMALESGCTPTAGGGCKVKKSVMWKVLDEECT